MADFLQPGSDGPAPFDLKEWRRGTVYTVRPEMLAPLERGREYRSTAIVRTLAAAADEKAGYAELYRRAHKLACARAAAVSCSSAGEPLHPWIRLHYWRTLDAGSIRFRAAVVSVSLLFPDPGQARPAGETVPTADELALAGGVSPEAAQERLAGGGAPSGELFNDFDFAPSPGPGMFSYGEYVASADAVDFEPYVERAQRFAQGVCGVGEITAREWYSTTSPDLAVVHLYYE